MGAETPTPQDSPEVEDIASPEPQNGGVDRRDFLRASLGFAVAAPLAALLENVVAAAEKEKGHHLSAEELKALIDKEWDAQNKVFKDIAELGENGMQKYYDSRPDKKNAFFSAEQIKKGHGACACCSDEGCNKYTNGTGEKMLLVRTPGSGILDAIDLKDKDPFAADFITAKATLALNAGVTVFTYHEGCGAAAKVYEDRVAWLKANGKINETAALEAKGPQDFAKRWAEAVTARMRQLAEELKLPHAGRIKTDFITKEMMDRPAEIHRARIIYVTDEDEFDASYKGLPQGFVERTGGSDANLDTVLRHVDILRKIGFNEEHGFGKKFSENPAEQFVVCCIAESEERLNILTGHARKQIDGLPEKVRKKIRVDGFVRS